MARGELRFWAIAETLLAMAVFWWVAIRYETFLLLTTSLFVAPLLLLRSDKSTWLGVQWIDEGMLPPDGAIGESGAECWTWRWVGIGAAIATGLAYRAMDRPRHARSLGDGAGRALDVARGGDRLRRFRTRDRPRPRLSNGEALSRRPRGMECVSRAGRASA